MKSYKGIKSKHGVVAQPVTPNAAVRNRYHARLDELVKEMTANALYRLKACYRRREKEIAADSAPVRVKKAKMFLSRIFVKAGFAFDDSPTADLERLLRELKKMWGGKFNSEELAEWFVGANLGAVSRQMQKNIKDAVDITVKLKMTRPLQNALKASVAENVALIRSIPVKYFEDVERIVMQSIQQGRDLAYLTDAIEGRYKVTRNRAALIARDQTNKVSSVIDTQRQRDLGITKSVWMHSGGGKMKRQSHVDADGTEYDNDKGCYIDGEYIYPRQKIRCKCSSAPVIPILQEDK